MHYAMGIIYGIILTFLSILSIRAARIGTNKRYTVTLKILAVALLISMFLALVFFVLMVFVGMDRVK